MARKISVIIPVYNVEKYIEKCIQSVLNQTYEDFEIILVDDGSTDNSGVICEKFDDPRIRVIHKKNEGLSEARNVGTKLAQGEYLTWLDGDDQLHCDFLKKLYELLESNNADIAAADFLFVNEGEKFGFDELTETTEKMSGLNAMKKMLSGEFRGSSACGFLIKTQMAKETLFPYKKYHEDDFTTYKLYKNANTVIYLRQPMYFYLQRSGSIMHKSYGVSDIDELDAADVIYEDCKKIGKEYESAAFIKKVDNYFDVVSKHCNLKNVDGQTYHRIYNFLKKNKYKIIFDSHFGKRKKWDIVLFLLGLL